MSAIFFADLDATTIYSKRHLGTREAGYTGLVVVETFRGEPLSYMTFEAVRALSTLSRHLVFVPTTTRDELQFARIDIPELHSRYAIVANGGRILVDGVEDEAWSDRVRQRLGGVTAPSEVLAEVQDAVRDQPWLHVARSCADLFVYAVAKPGDVTPTWFGDFCAAHAAEWGYRVSVQGRTTYLVPAGLTKEAAAAEVMARLGADVSFASGDSLLDVGLMRFATHAIQPRHGEANTRVLDFARTRNSGIGAGLEIIEFVSERL